MHINKNILVVSSGHDLAELITWAELFLQSYHQYKVTIVINSNFIPEAAGTTSFDSRLELSYFPSNRIIEPQILLVQMLKFINAETIYLLTHPNKLTIEMLSMNESMFSPILNNGKPIGLALNRLKLIRQKMMLPKIINDMRQTLKYASP